jgi:hypothetical protein
VVADYQLRHYALVEPLVDSFVDGDVLGQLLLHPGIVHRTAQRLLTHDVLRMPEGAHHPGGEGRFEHPVVEPLHLARVRPPHRQAEPRVFAGLHMRASGFRHEPVARGVEGHGKHGDGQLAAVVPFRLEQDIVHLAALRAGVIQQADHHRGRVALSDEGDFVDVDLELPTEDFEIAGLAGRWRR